MASAYDRIKASRRKFHESAGLTDQDIANFQQNYVASQDGAQLVADLKTAEQNLINSPATVRDQHKALADYASAMDRVSTFVGLGGQAPGADSAYLQRMQEQYAQAWNNYDSLVKANRQGFGGLGMQTAAGITPGGVQVDQDALTQRLMPGRGLIDFDTMTPTASNQQAAYNNALRKQYQNIQSEAGQEAARWSEQTDSAMSELETVQYWQDVVRKLPQGNDARIVSSNQEWMRQAAEATGITSYTDAADLSSQLAARESQLRAKSGWSGLMRDRNAGRQRTAMAYEYQLDNPDESLNANYYLALRDQAERDIQGTDNFFEGLGDVAAVGDWLRYNSAYGDQLYQDQKNADILALRTDANLSGIYQGALESTRKANEAGRLLDQAKMEVSDYGGVGAKTEQDVRALAETYGIPVTGGDDSLIAVLEQIYQQQMHTVNTNVARLSAQGYDGERVQQYIEQSLNEQSMDEYTAETRAYAQENPGAASVKSSLANLLSGGGYIASGRQAVSNAVAGITGNYENYVPIDTNDESFAFTQYVTSVRDEVAKNIVENGGDDFWYNTGMSMLDNMVQMAVGAMTFGAFGASSAAGQGAKAVIQAGIQSSAPVTLATMGLGAASQELVSLTEQGVSSDQAYALATLAGGIEIITEKIGVDNLVTNLGRQQASQMLQIMARQMVAEGLEEGVAETLNIAADYIIRMEDSEISQMIDAGRRMGLTGEEARASARRQLSSQIVEAMASGALSGLGFGAMSTVGAAAESISPASTGARIRAEGNEEALGAIATAYGIEYSPNMSDRQVGKTYRAVQKAAGRLQQDLQQGMSMDTYAQEKGYDAKTTRALNRSWDAYHSVYSNDMSSREFAATWNSMKAAGQANMGFADAVSELGETTLSQATLQNAWKAGQRLYNQAQKAAQKAAKNAPVAAQENVQQQTESAATLVSEIGEGAPAQTQLVERSSESASNHARELMDERINVNGLSDDVVESFYDEVDSDISTERRGALSVARMLTGVSKNISQVILVDNATTDAEGHVRLMSNGMWDPTNRTITIDINAGVKNVEQQMTFMTRAMSHEITHSIKTTAPKQYAELERFVLREMDKKISLDKMIEAKIEGYAKEGIELDRQGAIDELVAESCEQMLERTDVLNKLAQENKSLWEKIKDYIKSAIQKLKNLYKGMKANSPEARMLQGVIDELQRKWDAAFAASLTAEASETTGDNQHSIAGRNAEIANIIALDEAKQMEVDGYSESEIYQQTGWFRGADNMWRFEIDDSTMRYTPERMAQKMVDGAVHLEDVIDHPVLFSAYPRLRDVSVTFTPMKPGAEGVYRRAENRIYLADSNKNSPESTLVHEIQHAIQALEGFAYGASRSYWANIINNGGKIDSKRLRDATAAVRKFEGNKANQPVIDARNRLEDAYDKSVRDGNAMYAQMQADGMATKVDTYDDLLIEQSNAGVAYLNSLPIELYMNTAGEQEARDVAERRTMTAEQRKAKMPQTGTKDTVFVEGSAVEKVGVQIDTATKSAAPVQYSLNTWNSSDYVTNAEKAAADLAKKLDMSKAQAEKYIDAVNSIAKTIAESHGILDYESSPGRSSFVSNVEYGGSFDFSTLCAKRRLMTGTFSAIQEALPNTVLTAADVLEIRNRMKDAGLEVSCGLCYVEGSRANMGTFTKKFLELYEKHYGGFVPNMAQMNTPDGIEWVRLNHPEVYEQYEYFWNHYGTLKPGDPKLFASQQKPKLYQMRTEYKGEVLKNFTDPKAIKAKNDNGGIRLQSFSDFEIVHLIDCMQIITDMARVGLAGQAYTKVPEFAWALGDTGLKINLSLIAKGVDANGRLIFDDVEGMEINEAMRIRDRYSENVGTILVIFNDEQLKAAMADDRVDFIIPFHRSQWKKSQYSAMGLPEKTKDYTYMQNERYIKPQYHEYRGRQVRDKATNYMPNEYWDFSLSGKENAERYLQMCAENNKRPKFYRLLDNNGDGSYSLKADGSTDGYWKLLIDFKMYDNDGNGSPQIPVKPDFNMEKSNEMLENYKGGHRQFPVAQEIVDSFVADYKKAHPKTQYQISRDTASNMDLLMGASIDGLSKAEADHLLRYRDRVNEIRQNQRKIDELKAEELTADVNAQIKRLENANSIIYRRVSSAEQTELMQRIIERERAAGDVEVQRMDNRVADLEDEIDELEQKIRNAKLAGQMGQGRRDAAVLRKTEERLTKRNEKQKQAATEKAAKQKQQAAERAEAQKQKYTDKLKEQRAQAKQAAADARLAGQMEQGRRDAVALQRTVEEYEARLESKRRELRIARESRDKRIAQMQESRIKSMDSRHRTQMRHKIRKVVKELDALLLRGTKDRNIRDEMKAAVASALEAINMDSGDYEGRIAKLDEAIAAATDPVVIATLTESRERIAEQGSNMRARLSEMKTAYSNFSKDTSGNYNSTYDEVVQSYIDATIEKVGATPLWDMTVEQLDSVYNMYKMILTDIQQANKLVRDEKNRTIYSMGNSVIRELDGRKRRPMQTDVGRFLKKFGWDNLKPVYAFETIGSNTLMELYENVRGGEDTWARDVSEARAFYQERAKKYGLDKWDTKTRHTFYSRSGKEFSLDVNQIMSLYAYSKRSQADEHLQKGGFVFDSAIEVTEKKKGLPIKYKVNTKQAYGIDPLTLNDIIATLTDEQRNFVDEMQAYLSDTMGAKGNEVSLDMYGVRLFNEQNYFPLKTSKQFLFEQNEVAGEVKLKNSGFSKHTTPHASNPVILSNFMDVWGQHVNDMSMYHAFVIPLENFNRVYNYQTLTTDEAEPDSVKGTLADIYGDAPVNYIKQLLTDLNGGARVDPTASVIDWGLSKFKSAAVMASASVVIQQPTAVVRAAAFVNPLYLGAANKQWHKNAWEELKRYAPVAIIKEMGRFDTNMGRSTTDWITDRKQTGLRRVGQVADDVFSRPASFADEVGWLRIWAAVKKETANKTDLKPGTQEFLEHCGKRFTYIIERSQVYDSVLSRSATMRSKDTGMKMATAFMAEPLTTMNMLVGSFKMQRNGYRGAVAKTYGAVAASLILNSILVSLVYAARDDDEDETYTEKYFQALAERLKGNVLDITLVNTVPFLRDIISIFQGYDVSRTDMSMAVDFYKAYQTIVSDTATTYDKVKTVTGELARLVGLPIKNLWRDAEGIYNVVKGVLENDGLWTPDNAWGDIREGIYEGITGNTIGQGEKLYNAYINDDKGAILRLESSYQEAFGEDWYSQIQSDLRGYVKELYLEGDLTDEEATDFLVRYAIELSDSVERQHDTGTITDEEYMTMLENEAYWTIKGWNARVEDSDASTSKYADLRAVIESGGDGTAAIEELLEHGETEKEIRSGASGIIADLYKNGEIDATTAEAYLAEYAGITDSKDLYTWFTEKDHWVETGESDYGAYGPVWDAIIEGGDVDGAIDAMVDAGWTESAVAEEIRTRAKEWVLGTATDGYTISTDEARNILSKYGGVDDDDLDDYINAYEFWLNNPDYVDDFSISQANDYLEYGTGIDIDMFLGFREAKSGMVGQKDANGETISGSVKAEAMEYIDAMPITNAQKDQLYLMYWSESRIYEAPWH